MGVFPDGGGNLDCAFDPTTGADFIPLGLFCNCGVDTANNNCVPCTDGGPDVDVRCVSLCGANSDCGAASNCQLDTPLFCGFDDGGAAMFADGGLDTDCASNGGSPVGFCFINLCGPGLSNDGGILNSDYFANCDAHGTQDGTCLPELNGAGLCHVATDAGYGDACNPDAFNQPLDLACAGRRDLLLHQPDRGAAADGHLLAHVQLQGLHVDAVPGDLPAT